MKKNLLFVIILFLLNTIISVGQNNRKPLQIADEFNLNLSSTSAYFNHKNEGIIYTQTFSNEGSAYIKLHINSFDLKPGDYLKVYAKGEEFIYSEKGKIIGNNKEMISEFWTGTIWSDSITLELYTQGENKSHFGFNIDKVAYGHSAERINAAVKQLDNDENERTICSNDDKEAAVCYDGTEIGRKAKAVCRLIINGGSLCTGWLLGCDGSVMTNNHCIGNAASANNTDFLFNFQYDNCAETINATSDLVANNSAFVQTNGTLDFTLVTLPVNPTATYGYLSLSSVAVTSGERIYIPQHPAGRRKEIAVNTDVNPDLNGFATVASAGTGNAGSRVSYTADTEGGSSGSPVIRFDDHLVVAIHNTGGACSNGSRGRSDQLIAAIGANMPNCGIDDSNPEAPFVNTLSTKTVITSESTDCSYSDIILPVKIALAPSQNATVTLNVAAGTATNAIDFEIITPSLTFPSGSTAIQNATLRVFNDSFVEGNETIQINLAVNPNGGDAQLGNNDTFNIIIEDDNYAPNIGNLVPFFSNDFESGLGDFTVTGGPDTNFVIGNSAAASSTYLDTSANTTNFAFVNDDACNCNQNSERLAITQAFDFTNVNEASITFDYVYGDENGSNADNTAFLQVSTDSGNSWTNVGNEFDIASWATKTISLNDYVGQSNLRFAFHFSDLNLFSYGLGVDNIVLSGLGNATIQQTVNTANTTDTPLNSSGTIYTYDAVSGSVMTGITNNDNSDYGCLTVSVTRAGTSGQPYLDSSGAELAMDKSFFITATNAVSNGDNTITFYFTEAEIAGWEAAVANAGGSYTRTDLHILRDENSGAQSALPSTETSVATLGSFANHVTLTGTFTSVKGAYLFAPQSTLLSVSNFNTTNFGIFPNPVNNELTIKTANGKLPNSINVHNMLGQIIFKKSINSITDLKVNTSSLSNGMYFLSIQSDTAKQTIKFVKK